MNPTRKQILVVMERLLEEQPDMRFGQFVANLAIFARGPFIASTYDVEDDEFLDAATRHLSNLEKRREMKKRNQELAAEWRQKNLT